MRTEVVQLLQETLGAEVCNFAPQVDDVRSYQLHQLAVLIYSSRQGCICETTIILPAKHIALSPPLQRNSEEEFRRALETV